jgi:thiol-disulfide isomerase/thioredoxin
MNASRLTKNPTLVTAMLSMAAIVLYGGYRLSTADAQTPSPLADSLPPIILDDLAGMPTPLDSFSDGAMLVNFWATWCAPCLREIPLLKTFHEENESIEVVGIAVDDLDPVLEFADEMQFNYPVLIGVAEGYEAMAVFRNEAQVMPFTAFTAPGGAVLGVHYGELHPEDLEHVAATIEALGNGSIGIDQARELIAEGH